MTRIFVILLSLSLSNCVTFFNNTKSPFDYVDANVIVWFDGAGYCSGTIIEDGVVLTAAHCFTMGVKTSRITILSKKDKEIARAVKVVVHPKFLEVLKKRGKDWEKDMDSWKYDIAIVFMDKPIKSNIKISYDNTFYKSGNNVHFVGFGKNVDKKVNLIRKDVSSVIQQVSRSLISVDWIVREVCVGDSGGGLYLVNEVIGVCSRVVVHDDGDCGSVSIFIALNPHKEWIKEVINNGLWKKV
jgi:secreted trypsin-like serine protease